MPWLIYLPTAISAGMFRQNGSQIDDLYIIMLIAKSLKEFDDEVASLLTGLSDQARIFLKSYVKR